MKYYIYIYLFKNVLQQITQTKLLWSKKIILEIAIFEIIGFLFGEKNEYLIKFLSRTYYLRRISVFCQKNYLSFVSIEPFLIASEIFSKHIFVVQRQRHVYVVVDIGPN